MTCFDLLLILCTLFGRMEGLNLCVLAIPSVSVTVRDQLVQILHGVASLPRKSRLQHRPVSRYEQFLMDGFRFFLFSSSADCENSLWASVGLSSLFLGA